MAHRRIFSILRPLALLVALAVLMAGPIAAQVSQGTGAGPVGNAGGSATYGGPSPSGNVRVLWELEIPDGYISMAPVAWDDYALIIAISEEFGANLVVHDLHSGEFLWNHAEASPFSGPFINDGRVYLYQDDRRFALDIATGDVLWDMTLDDGEQRLDTAPGTVTGADGVIYTNQNSTLFALDGTTGDELWRRSFPGFAMQHPIVAGDVVVASSDAWEEGNLLANRLHGISRETGNEVWRRDGRNEDFGYVASHDANAVLAYEHPVRELVLSDADMLGSGDGQILWSPFDHCAEPDLTLDLYGDIYRCYGSTTMFHAATGTVLESPAALPGETSVVARVGDHLYLSNERGVLTAIDLPTGEVAWSHDFSGEIGELDPESFALLMASAGNGAVVVQAFIMTPDGSRTMTFIIGEAPASGATPAASPNATPAT